jgi:hypothetical protein
MSLSAMQREILQNFEKCWELCTKLESTSECAALVNETYIAAMVDRLVKEYDTLFSNTYYQLEVLFDVKEDD